MSSEIGEITSWNDEKGFGFISPSSGGRKIFIHINDFSWKHKRPCEGLSVVYDLGTDAEGRRCAVGVCPREGHRRLTRADRQMFVSLALSVAFFVVVGGFAFAGRLHYGFLYAYGLMSVVTFVSYAKDKAAARAGVWRTSEFTLHLFSLVGGWPGAAIAQSSLRHKSAKPSFRAVYWLTVILNCGFLAFILVPGKGEWLLLLFMDMVLP